MSMSPQSPRILKGGLVMLDPVSFAITPGGVIVMQYNPDTVTRTLKVKGVEEGGDRSEAVIVLGCPPRRNGQTHPMQRWRCQIGVRSMDPARDGQLIFSGAARPGGPSEAAVMSGYAHDVLGVPSGRIALETKARSTWQNVEFALPLAENADVIKFASDPMHAARARQYLLLHLQHAAQ